jgi:hypothetical protein
MFAAPLRTLPRTLPVRALPQLRHASTSTGRYNAYKSQTTPPLVYASVGLVALFGWTAAIITVGGKGGKKDKAAHGAKQGAFLVSFARRFQRLETWLPLEQESEGMLEEALRSLGRRSGSSGNVKR